MHELWKEDNEDETKRQKSKNEDVGDWRDEHVFSFEMWNLLRASCEVRDFKHCAHAHRIHYAFRKLKFVSCVNLACAADRLNE